MNDQSQPPRYARGPASLLTAMLHTRLELATMDVEAYVAGTIASMGLAFAALVLGLVAVAFIGVAVIAVFWDTHRVIATLATTTAYVLIALTVALVARSRWRARPRPLESTLNELELDRDAVRSAT
jgi:uncharacterized membrane protein YqjE